MFKYINSRETLSIITQTIINCKVKKQECTVDALALGADEGRDEQRNAAGSCK